MVSFDTFKHVVPDSGLMNAADFAECCGVRVRTVHEWIRSGEVPAVKVGKVWMVDLGEWLKIRKREVQG